MAALRKATAVEIAATPGIGPRIASLIEEYLQSFESGEVIDTQSGEIRDSNQ